MRTPLQAAFVVSLMLVGLVAAPVAALAEGAEPSTPVLPFMAPSSSRDWNAPAGTWSKNLKISTDIATHPVYTEPHIGIDKLGRLVAGFKEADSNTGGGAAVGVTYSADGGATWSAAKEHSGGSDIVFATDENDSMYLNRLGSGCGGSGICTYKSIDGGVTWGSPVATSFGTGFADKNWIDSDGKGRLYHVYDPGSDPPAATVSTDGGVSFKGDYRFADRTGGYGYPVVAGDRVHGGAYACYQQGGNVYFDKSKDGVTWGTDINLGAIASSPAMCMVAQDLTGRVYVAVPRTVSGRGTDVVVRVSEDNGTTFGAAVTINDDTGSANQYQVQGFLAVDSKNRMHTIWRDERSGQQEMWYSNSTDGGKTWSANIQVTDAQTPTSFTRPGEYGGLVVGPDDTLYADWADGRPDGDSYQDIYFSKMTQGGGGGNNSAPAAPNVVGPLEGFTNTSYSYNTSSTDPDNDQVKITIDWGDSTNLTSSLVSSGQNVQLAHTWGAKGLYTVKAMATDSKGATSAWGPLLQVTIDWKGGGQNNAPPAPVLAGPSTGQTSQSLSYAVQGTDPDVDPVKYTVDWGDTKTDTGALVASGTLSSFLHAWTAAGTYTVKAMSTDSKGATSLWSPTLTVVITDPVGNSAPAAPTVTGPLSVLVGAAKQYSVVGTDPDNDQVKYTIEWGDTNTETGALTASGTATSFTHSWAATGSYQVKAKTTDDKGVASGWGAVITVAVTDIPDDEPPAIQHTAKQEADAGKPIDIEATITDDVGVVNADLYYKPDGASSFTRLAMYAPGPSTIYKAIIPATDVKGAELKYYIEASDAAANIARDPTAGSSGPHVITINASPGGEVEGPFLSSPLGLLLLLVIAVVIAVLVAVMLMRRRKKDPAASNAPAGPYGAPPAVPPQYQPPSPEQPQYPPPQETYQR